MTAEPALKLVVPEDEVSREVMDVEAQARAVKITDAASYVAAGELWKAIKALRKKVDETFGPIISAAFRAHKAAVAKRNEMDNPLMAAEKIVKSAMSIWDYEQERLRKEEQARLAEIARKEEEERRLLEAIAAEEEAKAMGATKEEAAQEAAAIMEEPVYVPPPVVPKAVPKLQGGPVYRETWTFEVVNAAIIPREYLTPDMTKIGGVVRAMKGATNIPGIRAFSKRV